MSHVYAAGVDLVSVGALTHSAPSLDLGLDLVDEPLATPAGRGTSRQPNAIDPTGPGRQGS